MQFVFKSCVVLCVFSWDLTMSSPLYPQLAMLERIRALDPDRCAIVRWNGCFQDRGHVCLEFELLHMSLRDFLKENQALSLDDIRTVLNQVCCASSSRILHFVLQEQWCLFWTRFWKGSTWGNSFGNNFCVLNYIILMIFMYSCVFTHFTQLKNDWMKSHCFLGT